ncbi:hypothetical protein ACFQV4_30635 [Streptomyces thermocarboxydus]
MPGHLRTCQCRALGCHWHPRHRGCAGPVLLALTCDRGGCTWRLADACAACAAAMSRTAVVPPTLLRADRAQTHPVRRALRASHRHSARQSSNAYAKCSPTSPQHCRVSPPRGPAARPAVRAAR